jgi:hypothetical protein
VSAKQQTKHQPIKKTKAREDTKITFWLIFLQAGSENMSETSLGIWNKAFLFFVCLDDDRNNNHNNKTKRSRENQTEVFSQALCTFVMASLMF